MARLRPAPTEIDETFAALTSLICRPICGIRATIAPAARGLSLAYTTDSLIRGEASNSRSCAFIDVTGRVLRETGVRPG